MKIKSINLKGFGGIKSNAFSFGPNINIISGPNGSGKSTIKNAIQIALTGSLKSGSGDRDGSECNNIYLPKSKGEVDCIIDHLDAEHKISRTTSPASCIYDGNKLKLSKKSDTDALEPFGYFKRVLTILCDNNNFFNLEASEQQKVLLNYFAGGGDIDLLSFGVKPEELAHWNGLTSETIALFHKKFYDERYANNKAMESVEQVIRDLNTSIETYKISETKEALEADKTLLFKSMAKEPQMDNNVVNNLRNCEMAVRSAEASEYYSPFKKDIDNLNTKGLANKSLIEKISKNIGCCPLDNRITCNSANQIEGLKLQLEQENNELRAKVIALYNQEKADKAMFDADRNANINAAKSALVLAQDDYSKAMDKYNNEMAQTKSANEQIIAKINSIDNKLANYSKMDEIKSQIVHLETQLVKMAEWQSRLEHFVMLAGKSENSITAKIVSGNILDFFKQINEYAHNFGYTFEQNVQTTSFEILINQKTSNMLSPSEKIRASLAIQVAIAKLSGYNFLMIDEIEVCELANILKVIETLKEHNVQALLFGHSLPQSLFGPEINYINLD